MSARIALGLLLCLFVAAGDACQLRVTAASTEVAYPSTVETLATVLVSLRNDGATDCLGSQFEGPGLLLNVSGEPGGSAEPLPASAHPFRFESVAEFGGHGRCGGVGAQLNAQGMCTWSVLRPSETVVMRAELRASVSVPRPVCFSGVIFGDGQHGLFLVAQPLLAQFSSCAGSNVTSDGANEANGPSLIPRADRPMRDRAHVHSAIR